MNDNGYLFDKRILKKYFKKYAFFFVVMLVGLIFLNLQLQKLNLTNGQIVLIDIIIAFALIGLYELVRKYLTERKNKNEITIKQKDKSVIIVKGVKKKKTDSAKKPENVIVVEEDDKK